MGNGNRTATVAAELRGGSIFPGASDAGDLRR
jgi:hypothetical protein